MEYDIFEKRVVEANKLASNGMYNKAVEIFKELLTDDDISNNPSLAIWPAGGIVAAIAFIADDADEEFPEPGSEEYKELHKYLKIVIESYHQLDITEQENYRTHTHGFENWESILNLLEQNRPLTELYKNKSKKSGCFIATAVYGSYSAPEVIILKKFRDGFLQPSIIGKRFIKLYYFLSPSIAKFISNKSKIKIIVRKSVLSPFVKFIETKFSK